LNYAWKRNTPPLDYEQQEDLVRSGKLRRDEVWLTLQDFESGTLVRPHAGSVRWNEYRRKWVMIVQQSFGSSNLGEIWYAEADTPIGPWVYARKVVTHDKYSFYNPVHHKFFDQDGGRRIYFEGTYSELFAGSPLRTPRYDYNQIMYRLTLDDARLSLPSPVYQLRGESGLTQYRLVDGVEKAHAWNEVVRVAFFAMAPQRPHSGLVPIYGSTDDKGSMRLKTSRGEEETDSAPLFYAVSNSDGPALSPAVVPLYEYVNRRNGGVTYSTHPLIKDDAQERAESPICRVWVNPVSVANFDRGARHE
jgi:hypothetical protein